MRASSNANTTLVARLSKSMDTGNALREYLDTLFVFVS